MARFLVKTEPSTYSFANLQRDKRTVWDGVSNPVALKHLATIRKGDTVVVYHTGDEKQAVGLAMALSDAYPDPKLNDPKRVVVDLAPEKALKTPVTLAQVKADAVLKGNDLARLPRLSVIPFTEPQFARLMKLAGA
jgi:predicted RNA-binding protein with PUA-like domain